MDSDIGGILENLWGGDAQKNSLFCVRFRTLRYSKASKIKYYPALTVGWDYMGKLFLQHMWIYGSCYRQLRLEAW